MGQISTPEAENGMEWLTFAFGAEIAKMEWLRTPNGVAESLSTSLRM